MSDSSAFDPKRCPVCDALNVCAVEQGSNEPCWCTSVTIDEQALRRVPSELEGKACLCPRCAAFVAETTQSTP
ncbi:MAG TPA: cysteine-rich CWC family protein [Polyangiaceae bacterium]|nr:cysteine-rich CWC family protein [Polyangiaceae bacterium]